MKTEFSNVIFPTNSEPILDGLDAWAYYRVLHEAIQQACIMRRQGGGSLMFLTEIVGITFLRLFQVTHDIKLNAQK